jgi:Holliday junction resolvasome RuvABC endonuclease subunit
MCEATILSITTHIGQCKPDIVVIEMPAFSQTAKSALAIGMCWGAITAIEVAFLIPPSMLKVWSDSKRGDGKDEVKKKVLERVFLSPTQQRNDNIIDAVGICLMTKDILYTLHHEQH